MIPVFFFSINVSSYVARLQPSLFLSYTNSRIDYDDTSWDVFWVYKINKSKLPSCRNLIILFSLSITVTIQRLEFMSHPDATRYFEVTGLDKIMNSHLCIVNTQRKMITRFRHNGSLFLLILWTQNMSQFVLSWSIR